MASIKDVAKIAQVSISTVSLAMNYPERVSREKKEKIFAAMKQLQYVPATNERRKQDAVKRTSVALITGEIFGPYYYEMLRGISETLAMHGLEMIMMCGTESVRMHFNQVLENPSFGGVILTNIGDLTQKDIDYAVERGISTVVCHSECSFRNVSYVTVDNYYIGKMVANHLLCVDCESAGIMGRRYSTTQGRAEGFIQTMEKGGIHIPDEWDMDVELSEQGGYSCMKKLLEEGAELPEAFFCLNDEIALGVMQALQEKGKRVPGDVKIVGCDDIPISRVTVSPLTTIAMPKFEMGMMAVNLLVRQISGKPAENMILNGKLIIRESCGYKEWRRQGAERRKG